MKKYKIKFEGFAYVEADDEEEARDKVIVDDTVYSEFEAFHVEEIGEFIVEI